MSTLQTDQWVSEIIYSLPTNFDIKVMSSYKKPLPRKKTEALKIQTSEADFLLNSKNEFKQPAQYRVVRTRENDDPQLPGGRGRGAGGGRRPGGGGGARRRRGGQ